MSDVKMYHFGLDVAGVLSWPRSEFDGFFQGRFSRPSGAGTLSTREIRQILLKELAAGHKVIPYGEACTNWNHHEGCLGHEP